MKVFHSDVKVSHAQETVFCALEKVFLKVLLKVLSRKFHKNLTSSWCRWIKEMRVYWIAFQECWCPLRFAQKMSHAHNALLHAQQKLSLSVHKSFSCMQQYLKITRKIPLIIFWTRNLQSHCFWCFLHPASTQIGAVASRPNQTILGINLTVNVLSWRVLTIEKFRMVWWELRGSTSRIKMNKATETGKNKRLLTGETAETSETSCSHLQLHSCQSVRQFGGQGWRDFVMWA